MGGVKLLIIKGVKATDDISFGKGRMTKYHIRMEFEGKSLISSREHPSNIEFLTSLNSKMRLTSAFFF